MTEPTDAKFTANNSLNALAQKFGLDAGVKVAIAKGQVNEDGTPDSNWVAKSRTATGYTHPKKQKSFDEKLTAAATNKPLSSSTSDHLDSPIINFKYQKTKHHRNPKHSSGDQKYLNNSHLFDTMNLSNSRVTVPNDDDFKMAVAQNQEDDETSFSSLGSDLIEEMGKKDRKNSSSKPHTHPNSKQIQSKCEAIAKPPLSFSFKSKKITKEQYKNILKRIVNNFTKSKDANKPPVKFTPEKCKELVKHYIKKYESYNDKKERSSSKQKSSTSKTKSSSSKSQKAKNEELLRSRLSKANKRQKASRSKSRPKFKGIDDKKEMLKALKS